MDPAVALKLRWILGIALLCVGGFCIAANWAIFVVYRLTKRHSSAVPIVGGLFAACGLWALPIPVHWGIYVAVVLSDFWGGLPAVVRALVFYHFFYKEKQIGGEEARGKSNPPTQ